MPYSPKPRSSGKLPSVGRPRIFSRVANFVFGFHSRKLALAMEKSVEWHRHQKRMEGSPYAWHPFSVIATLQAAGVRNKEILMAGLLHDAVEDRHTTYAEVQRLFGKRVVAIVREVSKRDDGSFELKTKEGMTVKMADRIHNLYTLTGSDSTYARAHAEKPGSFGLPWIQRQIKKSEELNKMYGKKMKIANPYLYAMFTDILTKSREKYG